MPVYGIKAAVIQLTGRARRIRSGASTLCSGVWGARCSRVLEFRDRAGDSCIGHFGLRSRADAQEPHTPRLSVLAPPRIPCSTGGLERTPPILYALVQHLLHQRAIGLEPRQRFVDLLASSLKGARVSPAIVRGGTGLDEPDH